MRPYSIAATAVLFAVVAAVTSTKADSVDLPAPLDSLVSNVNTSSSAMGSYIQDNEAGLRAFGDLFGPAPEDAIRKLMTTVGTLLDPTKTTPN